VNSKELRQALRLIVITDSALAGSRNVEEVVEQALAAGARTIQLRDKRASARELMVLGQRLRKQTRGWDALLIINDRLDVALAVEADGVHLGSEDLPVAAARAAAPKGFLIGYSTNEVKVAAKAATQGADYIGCGAVFPTVNKEDAKEDAEEGIGVKGLARMAKGVKIPVVGIGGITPEGAREIADGSSAAGIAVISAVMGAEEPGNVVGELLASFSEDPDPPKPA